MNEVINILLNCFLAFVAVSVSWGLNCLIDKLLDDSEV